MSPHNLLDRLRQRSLFLQGQHVVRDHDVASLYGVRLNQLRRAVNRHPARFPPEFLIKVKDVCFFTETGVLMLSAILKSPQAAAISVEIIRELYSFPQN
jgi:hypothetical protein